jgi:hypothetical protein
MVFGGQSNWIPVSTNQLGAQGFSGDLVFIDRGRLGSNPYLSPPDLQDIIKRSSELPEASKGAWRNIQERNFGRTLNDPFGFPNSPSNCPGGKQWTNLDQFVRGGEQEGAVYGKIPSQAVYGKAYGRTYQGLRYGGKALVVYGAYNTYNRLSDASDLSERIGSNEPFNQAVAEEAGGWGGGWLGGMAGGALAGTLGAGPIGTVLGGIAGGIAGAYTGSKACGGAYRSIRWGGGIRGIPDDFDYITPY